jgi:hypothetical protein
MSPGIRFGRSGEELMDRPGLVSATVAWLFQCAVAVGALHVGRDGVEFTLAATNAQITSQDVVFGG